MRFATLGSGSAGNATLVQHGTTTVLIDCGLSARQAEQRAAALGFDIADLDAILVTHEHDDHVAGVATLARRSGASVWSSAGTGIAAAARLANLPQHYIFSPEQTVTIGALEIVPVIVPHDAREPCQFVLGSGDRRLGILTDVGQSTSRLERHYGNLDALMLEFNHDPDLLAASPYPQGLKMRIGGDYGHLSNRQAEGFLSALDLGRLTCFVAAHLSEKTNTPAHVDACLARCLPQHVERHIARQGVGSPWCEIR